MPQLVPFYFINQVVFAFIVLTIIIYLFSKYILRPLLHRASNSLEWGLGNPPKPHSFRSLPLKSSIYSRFILFIINALYWKKDNYLKLIICAFILNLVVAYFLGGNVELCDPGSSGDVPLTQGPSQVEPDGLPNGPWAPSNPNKPTMYYNREDAHRDHPGINPMRILHVVRHNGNASNFYVIAPVQGEPHVRRSF